MPALPNGIRLPKEWPPKWNKLPEDPRRPSYLESPPHVIPITGRQLFVDDFLIARTNLKRLFHNPVYHPANPVLRPDQPWERKGRLMAYVFSDGVWFDPVARLFKIWYYCSGSRVTGYAQSTDGIHWEKPPVGVVKGTSIVMNEDRDSVTVWMDLDDPDPQRRFKMIRTRFHGNPFHLHFSPDGIRWSEPAATSIVIDDRTTAYRDPFRGVWVLSVRARYADGTRARMYYEHRDITKLLKFRKQQLRWWTAADSADQPHPGIGVRPELYNLDAFPYESLMVGLFAIWKGHPNHRHKVNELYVGFSRNGFEWDRANRGVFLGVSETAGDWNWTNVQSAGGGCCVVGDSLYFYVSGRQGSPGTPEMGECSTGLAVLRRDGFASMTAGREEGHLLTRILRQPGGGLFVNAAAKDGELRAEITTTRGEPIHPFTLANSIPFRGDSTLTRVQWQGAGELPQQPARVRFTLRNAHLYSFWITKDPAGASDGYVAAGGPGLSHHKDRGTA